MYLVAVQGRCEKSQSLVLHLFRRNDKLCGESPLKGMDQPYKQGKLPRVIPMFSHDCSKRVKDKPVGVLPGRQSVVLVTLGQ